MISLDGEESNITSFHRERNDNKYLGASDANNYLVFCKILKIDVLEQDAIQIGDDWYSRSVLPQLITDGHYVAPIEVKHVVQDVEPKIDYDDVDLDEDEF